MATKKKVTKKKAAARREDPERAAPAGDPDLDGAGEPGMKREAGNGPEETLPGRFYRPVTDIYETGDALMLVTELPGATLEGLTVHVDRDVLSIQARVEIGNYEGLTPLYSEYNVGHFSRRFRLPGNVDADGIEAKLTDGVLVLELAKAAAHRKRRIPVG